MITLRKAVFEDLSLVNELRTKDDWLVPDFSMDEREFLYVFQYTPQEFKKLLKKELTLIVLRDNHPIGLIEFTHVFGQEKVVSWNVIDTSEELNESILKELLKFSFTANSLCIYSYDPAIRAVMLRNGLRENILKFFVYDFNRKEEEA